MTLLSASALFGVACWIFVAARIAVGQPWDYQAPDPEPGGARGRSLSVVVPAYNETENLRECLPTLLAQKLEAPWEVIVVDDRSTDETQEVLEGFDAEVLRVVRGEPRPEGWAGKNWAAHQGYRHARGDWLLFTDADVTFAPGALRAALGGAEPDRLTSRLPTVEFREPLSRLIEPTLALALSALAPLSRVNDPSRPDVALAWGGFLLFSRPLYERIGGHRAVRGRVVEDVVLARRTAAAGAATELLVTDRLTHVCSRSPAETARRYRRYWSSSWREDPGVAAAALAVLLGGHLLPIALWFGGGASAGGGWALAGLVAVSHLVALPAYLGTGLSPLWALGLWPALLVHALMALRTATGALRSR